MNALVTYPKFRGIKDYKVYTYEATTTTAIDTFSDWLCTIPNAWPVVLDSNGEAVIYVKESAKLVYVTPTGSPANPVWSFDNYYVSQQAVVSGTTTPGTTDNLYLVTSSPAQTVISNQMLLIMTPDVDSATTTSSHSFVGTGENDLIWYGPYTGSTAGSVFTVQIDATGTPDTFKWKKDGGSWTPGVAITGGIQSLIEGVTIKFARISGHTVNDLWALTVQLPVKINLDSLGAKIVYKNVAGDLLALGAGDMKANYPSQLIYSLTQGAWILTNPAAPSLTIPAPSRVRREVVGAYDVTIDDAGNEVSVTTGPVTLPAAADFANQFVYVHGVGAITISSVNSEKIYSPYDATGATSISIGGSDYDTVQMLSDSIGWYVLTAIPLYHGILNLADAATWKCPPGVTKAFIDACAGGGGGGGNKGAGGGAGKQVVRYPVTLVPGTTYAATVGTFGAGGTEIGGDGAAGGTTSLMTGMTTLVTLAGGSGGAGGGVSATAGTDGVYGYGGVAGIGGVGSAGSNYGSGGGGGDTLAAGGDGAPGLLVLEW